MEAGNSAFRMPPPSEKQARVLWFCLTALAVGAVLALCGVLFWIAGRVLSALSSVLLPLAIATILAYLLDPMVDLLERRRIPRPRAILIVFFLAATVVLMLLATVVPRLVVETNSLIQRAPEHSQQIRTRLEKWVAESPTAQRFFVVTPGATNAAPGANAPAGGSLALQPEFQSRATAWLGDVMPSLGTWMAERLRVILSWFGFFIGMLLVPVYLFYFLRDKSGIQKTWTDYLPVRESRLKSELIFILTSINDCLIVFFRGQVLVSLCTGTLLTLGFLALGLDYAMILGAMAGLLGIVPYLGMTISIIPAVTLAAVQYGDWWHPAAVIALFGVANMIEGLILSPKIIGDRVGLHPVAIIVAVMVGTTLMGGILGGVLAIPLTAALRALLLRYVWHRAQPSPRGSASPNVPS